MSYVEDTIYINSHWHTKQVRQASNELAYSGLRVVEELLPRVETIDPELDHLAATVEVRKALVPEYLPFPIRSRWDEDENWVFRFLNSRPITITPKRIDRNIIRRTEMVEYFDSAFDALDYLKFGAARFSHLLSENTQNRLDALKLAASTYVESRVLRLALYEGDYLIRVE